MDEPATLATLTVGTEAIVAEVCCERPVARRLMEMGVLPGTRVEVVRIAPLGDPIQLRVRSYSLSIRRREAAGILLRDVRETVGVPVAPEPVTVAERATR